VTTGLERVKQAVSKSMKKWEILANV
jgi:hypothetical protein